MPRGKTLAAGVALSAVAMLFGGTPAQANERAQAVESPDGETYYVYAHGGEFPTGHAVEIWQETNDAPATCASVPAGPPIGHATTPEGASGLQVSEVTCGDVTYQPDLKVSP